MKHQEDSEPKRNPTDNIVNICGEVVDYGGNFIEYLPDPQQWKINNELVGTISDLSKKLYKTTGEPDFNVSTYKIGRFLEERGYVFNRTFLHESENIKDRVKTLSSSSRQRNPKWSRDELILALDLYFREPSSHGNASHPEVVNLSELLNSLPIHNRLNYNEKFRNPNGIGMKLANFRALDPNYDAGLSSASSLDREVWKDFSGDLPRLQDVATAIKENFKSVLIIENSDNDDFEASEGRILTRIHRQRERCAKLANKKKNQVIKMTGKLVCEACGFNYEEKYGMHGKGFIECHHIKPVSEIKENEKTTLFDLAVVCASCHRMLHKSRPWLSLDELKKLILQNLAS